jgi:pheromone shutdown protein TraB
VGWRGVSILRRLLIWLLLPVYILVVFVFGTRARLADHLSLDDDHGLGGYIEGFEDVDKVLIDDRDRLLVDALAAIHETRGTESLRVGVVYGAHHMIAVVHVLSARFGYTPRAGEWLTVFDY